MSRKPPIIDMTDAFTKDGARRLKRGQVLIFMQDGKRHEYKIISKAGGKVFGRLTRLYLPEEVDIVEKGNGDGK